MSNNKAFDTALEARSNVHSVLSERNISAQNFVLHTKKSEIIPFMLFILFGSIHIGFSMSSANQLAALFNAKYGWSEEQQPFY